MYGYQNYGYNDSSWIWLIIIVIFLVLFLGNRTSSCKGQNIGTSNCC